MADYRKTSSDNLNANSPGSERNDKDLDYDSVRANLLLGLLMSKQNKTTMVVSPLTLEIRREVRNPLNDL